MNSLMKPGWTLFVCVFISATSMVAISQQDSLTSSPRQSVLKMQAVEYLYPEQVSVPAGKLSPVTLHFQIRENLHINSHTPRAEYLIPTVFSIPDSSGVKLANATYPVGNDFTLPADPDQKLSVYTGDFTIQAKIISTPGNHLVEAKLRYQACDQTQCLPPKTITVPIDVIGR
ncbi:MAG: disulfide bond formation protein DsbC [Acidobacteria bacterium]|nr:disulfide bond formation protein DsbC [Acidobacteriota bacterium]